MVLIFLSSYPWGANETETSDSSHSSTLAALLNWVFLIVIMVALWYFIMTRIGGLTKIKIQDREAILGERTLTFDTEKIQVKNVISETTLLWNGIKRWEQTPNLYLLFITHNVAHLIPKRVFSTETERQEFETLLKTKVQNLSDGKYLDA